MANKAMRDKMVPGKLSMVHRSENDEYSEDNIMDDSPSINDGASSSSNSSRIEHRATDINAQRHLNDILHATTNDEDNQSEKSPQNSTQELLVPTPPQITSRRARTKKNSRSMLSQKIIAHATTVPPITDEHINKFKGHSSELFYEFVAINYVEFDLKQLVE